MGATYYNIFNTPIHKAQWFNESENAVNQKYSQDLNSAEHFHGRVCLREKN